MTGWSKGLFFAGILSGFTFLIRLVWSKYLHADNIPKVTLEDIERIVRRDFPEAQHGKVLALLQDTGSENWQTEKLRVGGDEKPSYWSAEKLRVWSAILKLANGSYEAVGPLIERQKMTFEMF